MLRYLVCACGVAFVGNRASRDYNIHKVSYKGVSEVHEFRTRTSRGKERVDKIVMDVTKEEEQWKHIKAEFRLVNGTMKPVDIEDAKRVNVRGTVFPGNENNELFDVLRDAPMRLLCQAKLNSNGSGFPSYAVCVDCNFSAGGEYSGSWGAFHACGTRHKVIFYAAKITVGGQKVINLIPVPVRRCMPKKGFKEEDYKPTYTFNQQQHFPPDIDPYRHPVYQYSKCPKQDHIDYKKHMQRNASENAFPIVPWMDPYRDRYRALLNRNKQELIEDDPRIGINIPQPPETQQDDTNA